MLKIKPFILLTLVLSVVVQSAYASNKPLEKVTLQLKWLHQFQFAGYYAAQKQGFFEEEGLDVLIRERNLRYSNIEQVINGEAEYGIADSVIMLYQAKKEPVVIVAPIFQHSPQALITLKSSGIDSPYKLENKRIAFYTKDTDGFSILAMSHQLGLKSLLERVFIKTDPGMLLRGEADAYAAYLTNEPYFFHKQGIEINVIKPMNFGIDLYGDILFTTQAELEKHPERVDAFRRATIRGWEYALNHKKEIAQYILDTYQPAGKTLDHLLYEAHAIESMMDYGSTPVGYIDAGRFEYIANLFKKHGLIENKLDVSQGIYQPTISELHFSEAEKAWMEANPNIQIGVDPAWPPIEFVGSDGELDGISASVLEYVKRKTGLNFIADPKLSWPETIKKTESREIDLLSAVIATDNRKQYMNFSIPYLKFPMVIATRSGTPYISNLAALKGIKIAVVDGYAAHELMMTHYPTIELKLYDTPKQALNAVAKGQALGYVDNVAVIGHFIRATGLTNLQISGELPFNANVSMAIRNDWPLLYSIIQKTLFAMPAEELEKIQQQHLRVDYQQKTDWKTLLQITIPLIVIIALFIYLNRKLWNVQKALKEKNTELEILSATDHLTGIYNRSYLDKTLEQEIERSTRYNESFSVLLLDLDYFKHVNDDYGHDVGDKVLIQVTELVTQNIRKVDYFGRWGGEEFLLICPNSDVHQAMQLAEKIRVKVRRANYPHGFPQTISIGVCQYYDQETPNQLLKRVDEALYIAKHRGRDKSVQG